MIDAAIMSDDDSGTIGVIIEHGNRRRVRSDSVYRFLEVTALIPAPDWRHDELKGLLSHTSEEVRGG